MNTLWSGPALAELEHGPTVAAGAVPASAGPRNPEQARRAPRLEDFPPVIQKGIAHFRRHIEEARLARTYKNSLERLVLDAARWLCADEPSDGGLRMLLDEEAARRYMVYAARLLPSGQPRSVNSFDWHYRLLYHLWLSEGLAHPEVVSRIYKLRCSFRRDGRRGHPDLLDLRRPDPPEAPVLDEVLGLLERIEAKIDRARTLGTKRIRRLRILLTERVVVLTMLLNGFRAESVCSMRADWLKQRDDRTWRAVVLAKGTPTRKGMPPTRRFVVGDQTYTEWPLYRRLLFAYQELFKAYSLDLFAFLRTGQRDAVRWVVLTDDKTFGRAAPAGTEIAPLLLDWDGPGYLPRHRVEGICERLVRKDLKRSRGRMHIFRAVAVLAKGDKRIENPAFVEAALQMSPAMQSQYAVRADRDLGRELGTLDLNALTTTTPAPSADAIRPSVNVPKTEALASEAGAEPSGPKSPIVSGPPRPARREPRYSWRDLFEE